MANSNDTTRPTNPLVEQLTADTLHNVCSVLNPIMDLLTDSCHEKLPLKPLNGLYLTLVGAANTLEHEADRPPSKG